MRYIGAIRGTGNLMATDGQSLGPAEYDIDGFVTHTGEVVGALGVTGDVNEVDDLCAIDGIRAGGFRADGNFDANAVKRLNIKKDPPLRDPRKK